MLSTVSELRGLIETSMTDAELQTILDIAQKQLPSSATGNTQNLAHLYKSAQITLLRMKTNSELPELSKIGAVQNINKIDSAITLYGRLFSEEMSKLALGSLDKSTYIISKKPVFYGVSR
jgi:hypothetical protein